MTAVREGLISLIFSQFFAQGFNPAFYQEERMKVFQSIRICRLARP